MARDPRDIPTAVSAGRPTGLSVDGRPLEAAEWDGDRRRAPLVLLHEGLGSLGLWRGFPAALAAATGRRVVAYSRFGHGRSAAPAKPRTPAFFADEALAVLPAVLAQLGHHDDVDAAFSGWCDVWLDPAFGAWELSSEISELRAPTLLMQGIDDEYASLEQLDRIQAGAPAPIQRVELPAGHSPHLEAAEETVTAIAAFTARLP
jgi:pimeloyl-ACP methyl ester carboxylesterase